MWNFTLHSSRHSTARALQSTVHSELRAGIRSVTRNTVQWRFISGRLSINLYDVVVPSAKPPARQAHGRSCQDEASFRGRNMTFKSFFPHPYASHFRLTFNALLRRMQKQKQGSWVTHYYWRYWVKLAMLTSVQYLSTYTPIIGEDLAPKKVRLKGIISSFPKSRTLLREAREGTDVIYQIL